MPRVKRGLHHVKRRKNILARTKGYEGGRKSHIKLAKTAQTKAGAYAYRDRRVKKRTMRQLWNIRINATIRDYGLNYSTFIGNMKKKNIELNRKVLSELAQTNPEIFKKIAELVK